MATRMFLVGDNITVADIVVLSSIAHYFAKELQDYEKFALPHVFRWVDHIQHLPGLLEQIQKKDLFTNFPSEENSAGPSKA